MSQMSEAALPCPTSTPGLGRGLRAPVGRAPGLGGGCQMADDARPQKEEGKRGPTPPGARWPALASSALWRSSLWAILRPGHRAGWLRRAKVTSSRSEAETAFLGSGNVILGQRAVCPRRGTCDLRLTRSGVMLPVRCLVRAGAGPLQCGTWRRRPLRPARVLSRDTEEPPPHPDGARPGHGGALPLPRFTPAVVPPAQARPPPAPSTPGPRPAFPAAPLLPGGWGLFPEVPFGSRLATDVRFPSVPRRVEGAAQRPGPMQACVP